jgi:hypothetical protein
MFTTKCYKGPRARVDSLRKRTKLRKMDMRFGTWKMDLWEKGWGYMDRIDLAEERNPWRALLKTVITFGSRKMFENSLSSFATVRFSRRAQFRGMPFWLHCTQCHPHGADHQQTRSLLHTSDHHGLLCRMQLAK